MTRQIANIILLTALFLLVPMSAHAVSYTWQGQNAYGHTLLYANPSIIYNDGISEVMLDYHQEVFQGSGLVQLVIDPDAGFIRYTAELLEPQPLAPSHTGYDDVVMNSPLLIEMYRPLDSDESFDTVSGELDNINFDIPFEVRATFYDPEPIELPAHYLPTWDVSITNILNGYFYIDRDSGIPGNPLIYEIYHSCQLVYEGADYSNPVANGLATPEPNTVILLGTFLLCLTWLKLSPRHSRIPELGGQVSKVFRKGNS